MLASRGFLLGAKGRLDSACTCSVISHENEAGPVKEEDDIRLGRNDEMMARWMCNVRPEDRLSTKDLRLRLELKSMRKCLMDKRLQWFGHEWMEKSALTS